MKKFVFLVLFIATGTSLIYGLDPEERERDIERNNKEIEQKEWEQKQYDWWQEKRKIDQAIDAKQESQRYYQSQQANQNVNNRLQQQRLDQRRADDRAYERRREDNRR